MGLSPDSQGSSTLKSEVGEVQTASEELGEQKQGSWGLRLGDRALA